MLSRSTIILASSVVSVFFFSTNVSEAQPLVQTGDYPIDPIFQSQIPALGPLGLVSAGSTLSGLAGRDVITVALPGETASVPLFTLPDTIDGSPTFPGGFAPSDGSHILTGQTGAFTGLTVAGQAYLTPAGGGATDTHTVNGIFDGTVRFGSFYLAAAHGADSFGDSTGVYGGAFGDFQGSGVYALLASAGDITGLDLLFDTGTFSGAVAADPATGDIYFALGGDSETLDDDPNGFNDIWVLKSAAIEDALGGGTIDVSLVDYVASIGTGFSDGINGMVFDPQGRLLVGLTDFTGAGIDRILQFDIDAGNPDDYVSSLAGTVLEGSDSSVKIFDFVLDDGTLRVTAVPEPATVLLIAVGSLFLRARRPSHDAFARSVRKNRAIFQHS